MIKIAIFLWNKLFSLNQAESGTSLSQYAGFLFCSETSIQWRACAEHSFHANRLIHLTWNVAGFQ